MALKQNNNILATFSMASMTDVIFLLLVFFMVTSTFVFPTALDINLPQGVEQTPSKPSTMVFIDSVGNVSAAYADGERLPFDGPELAEFLKTSLSQDSTQTAVAIYADAAVPYGRIVDVLSIGASNGIKMVLATRPGTPATDTPTPDTPTTDTPATDTPGTSNP